ncbi:transcription termination factor NusA [Candidatus Dependentiae bacterium]|nr:transcription termination factor NusA [Candidatus Dependentiae bacterium]
MAQKSEILPFFGICFRIDESGLKMAKFRRNPVNLTDVINSLVEERGLEREKIVSIICEGVCAAYQKKYPGLELEVIFNQKSGAAEVFLRKAVVGSVSDDDHQITLRRAKVFAPKAKVGDLIRVPFEKKVGRIEIVSAKQLIANKIREVEQLAVFNEFKDKEGTIISGTAHKRERGGLVVKVGDVMAFLPKSHLIPNETVRVGYPIRALLKDVPEVARGSYQLILDRASADFVKKLLELEIPEVFEGLVEVRKIVRTPGYKTKALVQSHSKEIDPVGTCVGVGGARIKPILKELGQEKIDLIEWTDTIEVLVAQCLKPAEIDNVEMVDSARAMVWLAQDQRSLAIGKMGQNIMLASRLAGVEIQLQEAGRPEIAEQFVIPEGPSGAGELGSDGSDGKEEE